MTRLPDTLLATVRDGLSTAQLGDVLDTLGRRHQFLPPSIRPALPGLTLVGRAMPLPVFARGSYAQDQRGRGRVIAYREPVRIADVAIRPGDLIVGDDDGVLVVPSEVAEECANKVLEKRHTENRIAREIEAGLSITEAFDKYGIM